MAQPGIAINLLPKNQYKAVKKLTGSQTFQRYSLVFVVLVIIALIATVFIRWTQKNDFDSLNKNISEVETKLGGNLDKTTQIQALKQQLQTIQGLVGADQKRKAIFALVAFLASPEITVSEITIGKDGNTIVTASSGSLIAINQLIIDLSSPQKNAGMISKVEMEGLNLAKGEQYKFGLKITPK